MIDGKDILADGEIYLSCPVQHKLHFHKFIENKDLYYQMIKRYINCEDKPHLEDGKKNGYEFFIGEDKYVFKSKKGISNRKNGKGLLRQNFEYTFKLEYPEGLSKPEKLEKAYILFKPYSKDFYYKDGKPLKLPYGEGVGIEINTTYKEMKDVDILVRKILEYLKLDEFLEYENNESGVIRQCEYYVRVDEEYETRIANVLKKIEEMVSLSTDEYNKVTRNRKGTKYNLYSIRSNQFQELGFFNNDTKWRYGLKLYRLKDDSKLEENDPTRHPKVEIYLDEKKNDDFLKLEYPRLDDFSKLKETMFQILGNILLWASVLEDGLIQDKFYDPKNDDKFLVIPKKNAFQKLKNFYERITPDIRKEVTQLESKRDYLRALVHDEQINYKKLMEQTGLGYERVRKMTSELQDAGILKRIKTSRSIMMFKNRKTYKIVKAIVRQLDSDNQENKHKKKKRLMTRIKSRLKARRMRIERSEIPLDSKFAKILFRLKYLKEKDIDSIILSTYKMKEAKPPPAYYKAMFSDGRLSEGFI